MSAQPCSWCGTPTTGTMQVEEARYKPGRQTPAGPQYGRQFREKILVRRAIVVPACPPCADARRGTPPAQPQRRGRAKVPAEQMDIFDVLRDA